MRQARPRAQDVTFKQEIESVCVIIFLLWHIWLMAISLFFRASGEEAILGTQRYFLNHYLIKKKSRLRRGDSRYTTILFKAFSY